MKRLTAFWYLVAIIPLILLILGYIFPSHFFNNQEAIRNFVNQFGIFAPLIFIFLQIVQVIITPFSHYAVSIAGGFIFGIWLGFIYNWIGRVIGTIIAFYIARIFGRKILKHIITKESLKKYDYLFEKGKLLLFLAYFLPIFPDDEITYLAGFSKINSKIFILLIVLGHASGSLALAYIGNDIQSITKLPFILISIVTFIGGIIFILKYKKTKYETK